MKNKNIILLTIPLIILTLLVIGVTYAYYGIESTGESASTMKVGGANITANYNISNEISISDILPSNNVIGYKDFNVTYTNTSSTEYKIYLKAEVDYNTFTDPENEGVLYYDIYSGTNHDTLVQSKKQFPAIKFGKEVLYEIPIPANSKGTSYYRINFYFLESDTKFQNKNGNLSLSSGIVIENIPTGDYTPTLVNYISLLDKANNGLEEDDTDDKNLRYVGATPNNYISFNKETWRIIGIFNVYNNDTKKTEKLVKIIRNESLGRYSWDTSDSSINGGYGINEWSQADLMTELNTDYLDTSSGTTTWYNGSNNAKNGSYDYSKNIKSGYIDKIVNVRWNLGGATYGASAKNYYIAERGTSHVSNPSDGVTRTDYWNGKIALMYISDYGYASTDTDCRNNLNTSNCKNNNWLFNSATGWTLSPNSGGARGVFNVDSSGYVGSNLANYTYGVRPALFLKSDVLITGGTGTESDPYRIDEYYWKYDYTGSEQTFTAPVSGTYKLETWGAQGGNGNNSTGGFGGYSVGYVKLKANSKVSVVVGASDLRNCDNTADGSCKGGYNGGGNSHYAANELWGGGGGATHIATTNGLLSSLENNKNSILIVSGGGGGAYNIEGAHAGGFIGNNGNDRTNFATAIGGNQTSGGSGAVYGSFGQGGNCTSGNCTGGGGGYYGGGGAQGINGAGGSGYIGNSLLTNKAMYCYNCTESSEESTKTISTTCHSITPTANCAKEGNGYAKITLISAD